MSPEEVAARQVECDTDGCWHAFCSTCGHHLTPECER